MDEETKVTEVEPSMDETDYEDYEDLDYEEDDHSGAVKALAFGGLVIGTVAGAAVAVKKFGPKLVSKLNQKVNPEEYGITKPEKDGAAKSVKQKFIEIKSNKKDTDK